MNVQKEYYEALLIDIAVKKRNFEDVKAERLKAMSDFTKELMEIDVLEQKKSFLERYYENDIKRK